MASEHGSWRWVLKKQHAAATGAPAQRPSSAVRAMRTGAAEGDDDGPLTKVWLAAQGVSVAERATCFRLGPENPLRRACLRVVRWRRLEALVMSTVLLNAAALLLHDPMAAPTVGRNAVLHELEIAFNVAFTLEAAVRPAVLS